MHGILRILVGMDGAIMDRVIRVAIFFAFGFISLLRAGCDLSVMQFNIEDGGALVSLSQVVAIIQKENADVVCIQESEGRIPYIASLTGMPYFNIRQRVLSKFPIIDPEETKGIYAFIEVKPGKVVAVSNVHLPSDPYGPYLLEEGETTEEVEQVEKDVRLAALKSHLVLLPTLVAKRIPVVLSGDFNTPSALDDPSFRWPVSIALQKRGFRDSYREVHKSVQRHPGYTWWAPRPKVPGWNPEEDDPHDRIDFIYVSGPAKTVSSRVVSLKDFSPWPSDHKVVVSKFQVEPYNIPRYIAAEKRLVHTGEAAKVYYKGPKERTMKIALYHDDVCVGEQKVRTPSGHMHFDVKKSGHYVAKLIGSSGHVVATARFVAKAKDDAPTLSLSKATYACNEPIVASWKNAPGHNWDWIGVFSVDKISDEPIMAHYLRAEIDGTYQFDSTSQKNFPLTPGRYKASFFIDDARKEVTSVSFNIQE